MGNTPESEHHLCIKGKGIMFAFDCSPAFKKMLHLLICKLLGGEEGKNILSVKWLQKLQTFSITFPPKKLRVLL